MAAVAARCRCAFVHHCARFPECSLPLSLLRTQTNILVENPFYDYASGIFGDAATEECSCLDQCFSYMMNHAVVAVGYGSTTVNTYAADGVTVTGTRVVPWFKIRNSWAIGWGESGYIRIRREKCAQSGRWEEAEKRTLTVCLSCLSRAFLPCAN